MSGDDVEDDPEVVAARRCVELVREIGARRVEEAQRDAACAIAHEERRLRDARERAGRGVTRPRR